MRRVIAGVLAVVLLVLGYGTLDVLDLAPGILTRDQPAGAADLAAPEATGAPNPTATETVPVADPVGGPLEDAAVDAALPAPTVLRRALASEVSDPALGPSVGVTVRDAFTGTHLLDVDADRPRVPASTAKLLTALAVGVTLDPDAGLTTRVVQGATPSEVVLVAGGDALLSRGKGVPTAVAGRAGVADLAAEVAAALQAAGTATVTLRLDNTYAAGPRYAPGWNMADVRFGYTTGVSMVGLADQRPEPFNPAPTEPEREVLKALAAALKPLGVTATLAPASTWTTPAPEAAAELGAVESAPLRDVLALALSESDNGLTESLARQAAVRAGGPATFEAATAFVRRTVAGLGVDVAGVTLRDTSGLTAGQAIPARVLGDVMALGASGTVPAMRDVLAELPVAGLDGTLAERFDGRQTRAAAGIARAKTGTLTGASSLAGTLVDRDGRVLTYVVLADRVPAGLGTVRARAALDRFVAALASCGCR